MVMRDLGFLPETHNLSSGPSAREELSLPQTGKELEQGKLNRSAQSVAA